MRAIASLVLIAGVLASCGGPTATPVPTGPTPRPTATPRPTPSPTPTPPPTVSQACADELEDMADALDEMDGRLDIGLTFADYGDYLGDISVASNRLDIDALGDEGADCLAVALLLNAAFLEYIEANDIWNDCIQSTSCSTSSIETKLQGHWAVATDKNDEAHEQLP